MKNQKKVCSFAILTFILAVVISPFSSAKPDGLERVAEDLGFAHHEALSLFELFPDYQVIGLSKEWLATALSGLFGLIMCVGLIYGMLIYSKR